MDQKQSVFDGELAHNIISLNIDNFGLQSLFFLLVNLIYTVYSINSGGLGSISDTDNWSVQRDPNYIHVFRENKRWLFIWMIHIRYCMTNYGDIQWYQETAIILLVYFIYVEPVSFHQCMGHPVHGVTAFPSYWDYLMPSIIQYIMYLRYDNDTITHFSQRRRGVIYV